jgi:hypothetical protein
MRKLMEEFAPAAPLSAGAADRSPAADAIRRVVANPDRASQTLAGSGTWRAGTGELAASVTAGAPANGFSVSAASLSAADWTALYGELARRYRQEKH